VRTGRRAPSVTGLRGRTKICVPPPLAGADCADNPPAFHHVPEEVGSTDSFRAILRTYETSWKAYLRKDAVKSLLR
jgi:hypothetical protein